MVRTNGRSEIESQELDVEHELPASDAADENTQAEAMRPEATPRGVETASELQKLKNERDTLLDRLARLQAEFENARKRAAREQQEFREYAVADAVKAFLPMVDSFERALQLSNGEKSEIRGGVELIYKQLQDALGKLGAVVIQAKGEEFDPRVHEAVEMVETSDFPDHTVIEELQKGYKLKERLLRPAMVKVARNRK